MGDVSAEHNSRRRPRVAIVGAGASGFAAAWLLADQAEVVVFERQARLGGHAHSVELLHDGAPRAVDLAAQFFHPGTYPTFFRLLNQLGVATRPSKQTFTVLEDEGRAFFGAGVALRNLVGPGSALRRQWLAELLRLSAGAWRTLRELPWSFTLGEALPLLGASPGFVERVLYPVVGASFGTCREQSATMSARSALHYLTSGSRPVALAAQSYREVVGGCARWLDAVRGTLGPSVFRTNAEISRVERTSQGWRVHGVDAAPQPFDHLILAVQPSAAAQLLQGVPGTSALCARLQAVRYVRADLAIHGDAGILPADPRAWSGFIVHDARWAPGATVCLGRGAGGRSLFKTWAGRVPVRGPIHAAQTYWHPVMDGAYYAAQAMAQARATADGLHFAGSFAGSVDNHESAVASALVAAQRIAPSAPRVRILSPGASAG